MMKKIILLIILLSIIGCGRNKEVETHISGDTTVKGSEQILPMTMKEAYAFVDFFKVLI